MFFTFSPSCLVKGQRTKVYSAIPPGRLLAWPVLSQGARHFSRWRHPKFAPIIEEDLCHHRLTREWCTRDSAVTSAGSYKQTDRFLEAFTGFCASLPTWRKWSVSSPRAAPPPPLFHRLVLVLPVPPHQKMLILLSVLNLRQSDFKCADWTENKKDGNLARS